MSDHVTTGDVRAAVVGIGHLGALHAAKYAATDGASLAGVYDIDRARAERAAASHGGRVFDSLESLLDEADCVSIATPTATHRDVALAAIARGVDVLVEKPLAASLADARELVIAAARAGVNLYVGHLERFNPAFADLPSIVTHPRFIECHRLSPFAGRGADTDVVFDVMIHDLDLIAFVVGRAAETIEAIGVPVLSDHADIANARIRFEGGCIANVTASRVSLKRERRLRIFQEDAYVAVDFDARSLRIVRRKGGAGPIDPTSPMDAIEVEERTFADDADPLGDEIAAFVRAVATRRQKSGTGTVSAKSGTGSDLGKSGTGTDFAKSGTGTDFGKSVPVPDFRGISGAEALVAVELAERVRVAAAAEAARTSAAGPSIPTDPAVTKP